MKAAENIIRILFAIKIVGTIKRQKKRFINEDLIAPRVVVINMRKKQTNKQENKAKLHSLISQKLTYMICASRLKIVWPTVMLDTFPSHNKGTNLLWLKWKPWQLFLVFAELLEEERQFWRENFIFQRNPYSRHSFPGIWDDGQGCHGSFASCRAAGGSPSSPQLVSCAIQTTQRSAKADHFQFAMVEC